MFLVWVYRILRSLSISIYHFKKFFKKIFLFKKLLLFAFFRSLIECSLVEDKKIEMSVQYEKQTQWFQRLSGLRSGGRR